MFKCLFKVERLHLKNWTCQHVQLFNFPMFPPPPPLTDMNNKFKIERLKSWQVGSWNVEKLKSRKLKQVEMLQSWKLEKWNVEKLKLSFFNQTSNIDNWNLEIWEGSSFSSFQVFNCSFKVEKWNSKKLTFQHVQLFNFPHPPLTDINNKLKVEKLKV